MSDRKFLLLGKNGQIGWELRDKLAMLGEVVACGRDDVDLGDGEGVRRVVRAVSPAVIINAAAYTAVDRAEEEPRVARAVNGIAPGIIAEEAKRIGALLVHYSTDYVFDGHKNRPYRESDEPKPLNMYGATKLEGEERVKEVGGSFLILRTSWVYGLRGRNFLRTMLRLAEGRGAIRVVNDQRGSPTWARLVAEASMEAMRGVLERHGAECSELYHLAASGSTTWYHFAKTLLGEVFGAEIEERVVPIESAEFPTAAVRPGYSVLDCTRFTKDFDIRLPGWRQSLRRAVQPLVDQRANSGKGPSRTLMNACRPHGWT